MPTVPAALQSLAPLCRFRTCSPRLPSAALPAASTNRTRCRCLFSCGQHPSLKPAGRRDREHRPYRARAGERLERERLAKQAEKNERRQQRREERAVASGGVAKKTKKKAFRIRKGVQIKVWGGAAAWAVCLCLVPPNLGVSQLAWQCDAHGCVYTCGTRCAWGWLLRQLRKSLRHQVMRRCCVQLQNGRLSPALAVPLCIAGTPPSAVTTATAAPSMTASQGIKVTDSDSKKKLLKLLKAEQAAKMVGMEGPGAKSGSGSSVKKAKGSKSSKDGKDSKDKKRPKAKAAAKKAKPAKPSAMET